MKKIKNRGNIHETDDMLPEYDFRGMKGVRGKYHQAMREGYTITIHKKDGTNIVKEIKPKGTILLEPDVQQYFPDSKSVNAALRSLITLIPSKRATIAKESKSAYKTRRDVKR